MDAALVAGGVLLVTAPWWGTVLAQNGLAPFQSALNTGGHTSTFWVPWITVDFAEERFATVLTVLGLIGFAVQCIKKDWFLPVWLVVPFVIEPRSATAIAALPLAVLAGIGLSDFVLPKIASLAGGNVVEGADWTAYMVTSRAVRIVAGYVLFSAFVGAFAYDLSLATYIIPPAGRSAMQWAQANTVPGARFLVLTARPDPFSDPSEEWFPVLAQRTSQNTIQGREWTLGKGFMPFLDDLATLDACRNAGPDCVDEWAHAHDLEYDYIYLEGVPGRSVGDSVLLGYELERDPRYQLVFEKTGVAIFARK